MRNLRNSRKRLPTRFAPPNYFELPIQTAAPFTATEPSEFERLKDRLVRDLIQAEPDADTVLLLRRAAQDAAAIAWAMPFPLLFLPELLAEKVTTARGYGKRQAEVRRRTRPGRTIEVAA